MYGRCVKDRVGGAECMGDVLRAEGEGRCVEG